jgi:hypothetical protein
LIYQSALRYGQPFTKLRSRRARACGAGLGVGALRAGAGQVARGAGRGAWAGWAGGRSGRARAWERGLGRGWRWVSGSVRPLDLSDG